jgi:electron transfer flavoprotein alpha subunit
MNKVIILTHNFLQLHIVNQLFSIYESLNIENDCSVELLKINLDNIYDAPDINDDQLISIFDSNQAIVLANNDDMSTIILSEISVLLNSSIVGNVIKFTSVNEVTISKYTAKVLVNLINNNRYKLYSIDCNNLINSANFLTINYQEITTHNIDVVYPCKSINRTVISNNSMLENNLKAAKNIVSGGIALGNADNFKSLIIALSEKIKADYAGSLIAAEQKLMPFNRHIGQTGINVSPNWYIAIGISGAPQHILGITNSKNIISINKDSNAPIFQYSDYGIVGDLFEIIPKLLADL